MKQYVVTQDLNYQKLHPHLTIPKLPWRKSNFL